MSRTLPLFVTGLALGALAVFLLRAVALEDESASTAGPPGAEAPPPDPHAGHPAAPGPDPHAGHPAAPGPAAAVDPAAGRPPENRICPVMGNAVDPKVFVDFEGRRIGFCCPGCDEEFLKDPAKYLKKVDAELAARGRGDE